MSKNRFRRTLDNQRLSDIEDMGEKFAQTVKLADRASKCNAYIGKHRTIILPLIVLLSAGMLALGFSLDRARYNASVIESVPPSIPTQSNDNTPIIQEYSLMIEDGISIADSIQTLLDRGELSPEDSLYIINGVQYLDNINQLSKTK